MTSVYCQPPNCPPYHHHHSLPGVGLNITETVNSTQISLCSDERVETGKRTLFQNSALCKQTLSVSCIDRIKLLLSHCTITLAIPLCVWIDTTISLSLLNNIHPEAARAVLCTGSIQKLKQQLSTHNTKSNSIHSSECELP